MGEVTRESQDTWTRGGTLCRPGIILGWGKYLGIPGYLDEGVGGGGGGRVHCAILGLSWDGRSD